MGFTINDIIYIKKKMNSTPFIIPDPPKIAMTLNGWINLKKQNYCYAQWTLDELNNYDSFGYIGSKSGVECYILNA